MRPTSTPVTFPTRLSTPTPVQIPTPLPTPTPVRIPPRLATPTPVPIGALLEGALNPILNRLDSIDAILATPSPTPTPAYTATPVPTVTPIPTATAIPGTVFSYSSTGQQFTPVFVINSPLWKIRWETADLQIDFEINIWQEDGTGRLTGESWGQSTSIGEELIQSATGSYFLEVRPRPASVEWTVWVAELP